jgi:hypothetical protein
LCPTKTCKAISSLVYLDFKPRFCREFTVTENKFSLNAKRKDAVSTDWNNLLSIPID